MTQNGRWHPPMSTEMDKLDDFGTPQSNMGDEDGDHPWLPARSNDEFGTPTLKETEEFYDQGRPEDITILERDGNE